MYLWTAIFAAGMAAGGFAVKHWYQAGRIAALEASVAAAERAKGASEQALTTLHEQLMEVAASKARVKEIVKYVPQNVACNLTLGAVCGLRDAYGQLSCPAGLAAAEKQAATRVTQADEIGWHADCATDYRELAARHDALSDWWRHAQPRR
jgi:hypothetical protein